MTIWSHVKWLSGRTALVGSDVRTAAQSRYTIRATIGRMRADWSLVAPGGRKPTTRPDAAIARLAAIHWGVLSADELRGCGLSYKAIEVRVRDGHLHPLYRGVYAVGHTNVKQEGAFLAAVKPAARTRP